MKARLQLFYVNLNMAVGGACNKRLCPKRRGSRQNGASDRRTVWAEGEFTAHAPWVLEPQLQGISSVWMPLQLPHPIEIEVQDMSIEC